ncbi:hypothetical protein LTR17_010256, partial [Elasticomyces elasticus]
VVEEMKAKVPSLKNKGEAKNLLKLEAALDAIDCNTDMTLNRDGFRWRRDYEGYRIMAGSCVRPNCERTREEEQLSKADIDHIGHDCDQVRAMIARLVRYGDGKWTIGSFRRAVGHADRPKMIDFLQRKGPKAGRNLTLFELSWEFFRKRELLGIVLPGPPTIVREAANALKRKRAPLEERVANVAAKSAEERHLKVKARKVAADPETGRLDYDVYRKVLARGAEVDEDSIENHQEMSANSADPE